MFQVCELRGLSDVKCDREKLLSGSFNLSNYAEAPFEKRKQKKTLTHFRIINTRLKRFLPSTHYEYIDTDSSVFFSKLIGNLLLYLRWGNPGCFAKYHVKIYTSPRRKVTLPLILVELGLF